MGGLHGRQGAVVLDTVTYGGAYSYHNVRTVSDTGASGWNVWAYTAQLGNGWSATLSLEDPNRFRSVVDVTQPAGIASRLHLRQRLRRADRRTTACGCRT